MHNNEINGMTLVQEQYIFNVLVIVTIRQHNNSINLNSQAYNIYADIVCVTFRFDKNLETIIALTTYYYRLSFT